MGTTSRMTNDNKVSSPHMVNDIQKKAGQDPRRHYGGRRDRTSRQGPWVGGAGQEHHLPHLIVVARCQRDAAAKCFLSVMEDVSRASAGEEEELAACAADFAFPNAMGSEVR